MPTEFCTQCGAPIKEGTSFCTECGASFAAQGNAPAAHEPALPEAPAYTPAAAAYYPEPQPAYASPVYDAPPPKGSSYAVLGTGGFVGSLILMAIPVIGWIFCIVWACGGCKNKNRTNLARAMLVLFVIGLVLGIALYFVWTLVLEAYVLPIVSDYFWGVCSLLHF